MQRRAGVKLVSRSRRSLSARSHARWRAAPTDKMRARSYSIRILPGRTALRQARHPLANAHLRNIPLTPSAILPFTSLCFCAASRVHALILLNFFDCAMGIPVATYSVGIVARCSLDFAAGHIRLRGNSIECSVQIVLCAVARRDTSRRFKSGYTFANAFSHSTTYSIS